MKCEFCGNEFSPKIEIDARFCSDVHRTDWHNQQRKLIRLENRARKAIEEIIAISSSQSTNKNHADGSLQSLVHLLDKNVDSVYFLKTYQQND
mgnify:CR=1 FL=1